MEFWACVCVCVHVLRSLCWCSVWFCASITSICLHGTHTNVHTCPGNEFYFVNFKPKPIGDFFFFFIFVVGRIRILVAKLFFSLNFPQCFTETALKNTHKHHTHTHTHPQLLISGIYLFLLWWIVSESINLSCIEHVKSYQHWCAEMEILLDT